MSTVTTYISSCALITDAIYTEYDIFIGFAASYLIMNFLCLCSSTRFIPLIVPSHFILGTWLILELPFYFVVTNHLVKQVWRCTTCAFVTFLMDMLCFLILLFSLDFHLNLFSECKLMVVVNKFISYLCCYH